MEISKLKNFLLDLFFPKFCFGCQREEVYLCEDCKSILDISAFHQKFQTKNLNDLYFATEYKNFLIRNLIQKFKYKPFVKELSISLSSLIIEHFQLLENPPPFFSRGLDFVLIPVPLGKRKLRWRGFNQAEEIAKVISKFLEIPLINNALKKERETLPQVELTEEERKENILGTFSCQNQEKIQGRKILLVDDVYTTGSTMEECARVLKESGAKEIIGIVVTRAKPGEDTI
ncbi:MAG: ComF family protein [Candidatus Paceibacterales bacterium]